MKIKICSKRKQEKPKIGDEKTIKGILHRREIKIINDPIFGFCHDYTGGRPHYVWVPVKTEGA